MRPTVRRFLNGIAKGHRQRVVRRSGLRIRIRLWRAHATGDSREGGIPLFPHPAAARWVALRRQAMGDGIMDAAVLRRGEGQRPVEAARTALMARRKAAIDRTIAALEADVPHQTLDIGSIAIGCALGYLDFRFPHEPWRPAAPKLAAWFVAFAEHPCMARTVPKG